MFIANRFIIYISINSSKFVGCSRESQKPNAWMELRVLMCLYMFSPSPPEISAYLDHLYVLLMKPVNNSFSLITVVKASTCEWHMGCWMTLSRSLNLNTIQTPANRANEYFRVNSCEWTKEMLKHNTF